MQLLLRIRNSPGALALGARPSDDDSPRRAGPLYRPVRRLVNRSSVNEQIDFSEKVGTGGTWLTAENENEDRSPGDQYPL
jgi:hypothetical protein